MKDKLTFHHKLPESWGGLRKFERIEIEIYKPEIFNQDKFRNRQK